MLILYFSEKYFAFNSPEVEKKLIYMQIRKPLKYIIYCDCLYF